MWSSKMSRNSQILFLITPPNKANSFFCFLLFVQSFNCVYVWNRLPNLCGVFTKLKPKQYPSRKCQKNQKSPFLTSDSFCLMASQWRTCNLHICKTGLKCTVWVLGHTRLKEDKVKTPACIVEMGYDFISILKVWNPYLNGSDPSIEQ